MNTRSAIAILLSLSLLAIEVEAAEKIIRAESALAQIRKHGAEAFLKLHGDSAAWDRDLLAGIEEGSPTWLKVAELLKLKADGALGEEIGLALYGALPKRPFEVIPVLRRVYRGTTEEVCTQTFEAAAPPQGVDAYLAQLEANLSRARTSREKTLASSCAKGVAATREHTRTTLPK